MKKALKFLAIALCIIPCVMLFAACGSIEGKTYKFDKIELEFSNATEEQKTAFFESMDMTEDEFIQSYGERFGTVTVEFTSDGKMISYRNGVANEEVYYYLESGDDILIYEDEAHTIINEEQHLSKEGNKVVLSHEDGLGDGTTARLKMKIYYKKA